LPNAEVINLQKRAGDGEERARAELAVRYYFGEGVPVDYELASSYCRQSDHPFSKFILSIMVKYGVAATRNFAEARRLNVEAIREIEQIAQVGDGLAYYCLGKGCLMTKSPDLTSARAYFQKALDLGCSLAMEGLGSVLIREKELERIRSGFLLLQSASVWGSAYACKQLANFYLERKNEERGIYYLELAVGLQEPGAMVELGLIYGNRNDFDTAANLFQKAWTKWNDYPEAQSLLAFCYYHGRGVRQDYHRAFYFANLAARNGDGDGCILLATLYRYGFAVPTDYVAAYVWTIIGIARGTVFTDFAGFRDSLEKSLTSTQIAEGQMEAGRLQKEIERHQNDDP